MSLQELQTTLIERVSQTKDMAGLTYLAKVANEVLPPRASSKTALTDDEYAAALKGRQQIANGQFGTLEDLNKAVKAAIAQAKIDG